MDPTHLSVPSLFNHIRFPLLDLVYIYIYSRVLFIDKDNPGLTSQIHTCRFASPMATMHTDLTALLTANNVPQEVIAQLESDGCTNLKLFSQWAKTREDIKVLILDKIANLARVPLAMASVAQSLEEATAIVSEQTKRSAQGLDSEIADDPLQFAIQQQLEQAWSKKYSFELEPKYQPSNSMLGRIKREFDKRQPTIFNIHKVRTVYNTNKTQEAKKRKLATGVLVQFEEDAYMEDDQVTSRLRHLFAKFDVLGLAWSLAGLFDFRYDGKDVLFCHWQEAQQYIRNLREKVEHLTDTFSEDSVTYYFLTCEEQVRGYVVEYVRQSRDPLPWGMALSRAFKENKDVWVDHRSLLRTKSGGSAPSASLQDKTQLPVAAPVQASSLQSHRAPQGNISSPLRPNKNKSSSKGSGKGSPRQQSKGPTSTTAPQTATHTNSGIAVCKRYNDSRGCKKPCPDGKSHVCDLILAKNNQMCGRGDHNRRGHDPSKHGAAANRT